MSARYEIRGSNILYKVWGIITFVFAGIYGMLRLIWLVLIGIGSSLADEFIYGIGADFDQMEGYLVVGILVAVLIFIVGLTIRILAGIYLVRNYVGSKGAMITVSVFYFLISLLNLISMVFCGKAGIASFTFFYLFCMCWAIATGVFLILKQAMAVAGGGGYYGAQAPILPDPGVSYPRVIETDRQERIAYIEGLFGDYIGRKYRLRSGEICRIGRDPGCDIQLHHSKVSRIHCAVKLLPDGRFEVTDCSYNGTYYENKALPNGVAIIVEAGGVLAVGDADNVLSLHIG